MREVLKLKRNTGVHFFTREKLWGRVTWNTFPIKHGSYRCIKATCTTGNEIVCAECANTHINWFLPFPTLCIKVLGIVCHRHVWIIQFTKPLLLKGNLQVRKVHIRNYDFPTYVLGKMINFKMALKWPCHKQWVSSEVFGFLLHIRSRPILSSELIMPYLKQHWSVC
jgi:hypothetical protein